LGEALAKPNNIFKDRFAGFRSSTHPTKLFREFRTKSDKIGAFSNEDGCLTIFFLVIQRDHTKHDRPNGVAKT
jgi:hypothetical protein